MSSWTADRTPETRKSKEEILSHLRQVNALLEQLAFDSDLTDDFKDPIVIRAIKHWTNEKRLSPEEASVFQDNYRVMSVLQKINNLQKICRQAGIPVPLEIFLHRKPELSINFLSKSFGTDVGAAVYEDLSRQLQEPGNVTKPISCEEDVKVSSATKASNKADLLKNQDVSKVSTIPKREYGPANTSNPINKPSNSNDSLSASMFWSRRKRIEDADFSSNKFLLFFILEILLLILFGIIVSYLLKKLITEV